MAGTASPRVWAGDRNLLTVRHLFLFSWSDCIRAANAASAGSVSSGPVDGAVAARYQIVQPSDANSWAARPYTKANHQR